jgi:peptidoglycan hydrolase-like protein with peptidoglycan-binding domain
LQCKLDYLPTSETGNDHDENTDPRRGIVLVLGIGGVALDIAADADDVPNPLGNMASASGTDIRWVQVELHTMGLYNGSLDGVVGAQTKQALLAFQESNGIEQTATLDQQTAVALIGNIGVGSVGSSMPPTAARTGSASSFGNRTGQK